MRFQCLLVLLGLIGSWRSLFANEFQEQATLRDVCFVNPQSGWAVGDRGTILSTSDGGRSWQLQNSSTTCRLESVCFLDTQMGWAAGGFPVPFTHRSQGVLLFTHDGGAHWSPLPARLMPWLARVYFHDANNGFALGQRTQLYTSGIFLTSDGGRNWTPIQGKLSSDGVSLALDRQRNGIVLTRNHQIREIKNGKLADSSSLPLADVTILSKGQRVAAGDRGSIFVQPHPATRWIRMPQTREVARTDFTQVQSIGFHCWAAGTPGKAILRSTNEGRTWESFSTEQPLPIQAISFVDENHGWAVGPMGLILRSRDGGKTWENQRGGKRRVAIFAIYEQDAELPWEWFAESSAFHGYHSALLRIGKHTAHSLGSVGEQQRIQTAFESLGGVHTSFLATAQNLNDADNNLFHKQLEIRIRMWRPDVVLIGLADAAAEHSQNFKKKILRSVQQASKESIAGDLPSWSVSKVCVESVAKDGGRPADRLILPLGKWTHELAENTRRYVESTQLDKPRKFVNRTRGNQLESENLNQLVAAVTDRSSFQNRRSRGVLPRNAPQIQKQAQTRRNFFAMLRRSSEKRSMHPSQLQQLLDDLPPEHQANALFEMASESERRGDYATSSAAFQRIANSESALAEAAAIRFSQQITSEEIAVARQNQSSGVSRVSGVVEYHAQSPENVTPIDALRSNDQIPLNHQNLDLQRKQLGAIQRRAPSLFFDPELRFAANAWKRTTQDSKENINFYKNQYRSQSDFHWRACAATELSLLNADESKPFLKPIALCSRTVNRPLLDGILDESFWEECEAIALKKTEGSTTNTQLQMAFDTEFLYLGIVCGKATHLNYTSNERVERDSDLTRQDRVELKFDVDRDYSTFWKLAVDSRGFAADAVTRNEAWNPIWYMATSSDDSHWIVEAAIHLTELSKVSAKSRDVWGFDLVRRIPGAPADSWSKARDHRANEFGLLRFQ